MFININKLLNIFVSDGNLNDKSELTFLKRLQEKSHFIQPFSPNFVGNVNKSVNVLGGISSDSGIESVDVSHIAWFCSCCFTWGTEKVCCHAFLLAPFASFPH